MGNGIIQNIISGISGRGSRLFSNPYRKVGIGYFTVKYLKHATGRKRRKTKLLNNDFHFENAPEFLHGVKEIFVDEIYLQQLPPNALIFDCGAHIGMSVVYLKTISPGAHVVAFEPDKNNFKLLQENVQSFNLSNVTVENKAVWTENTRLSFEGGMDMSSHIVTDNNGRAGMETVEAVRLKDYMTQPIHFMKMDIEGAEYAVIKDIEEKLVLVERLFLEYHGSLEDSHQLTELFCILSRNQFRYYIEEAIKTYPTPFYRAKQSPAHEVQLNIYCFKQFR